MAISFVLSTCGTFIIHVALTYQFHATHGFMDSPNNPSIAYHLGGLSYLVLHTSVDSMIIPVLFEVYQTSVSQDCFSSIFQYW